MTMQLVLSLFSGAGLLDKAFKEKGFCVVSAGDIILNHDIRDFTGMKDKFSGLIGGPPCRWFSKANRDRSNKHLGIELLNEFKRVVLECSPDWALIENVSEVPNLYIDGYSHQRIDINQSWYEPINRLRHIQFYSKHNLYLHWDRKNVTDQSHKFKCDSAALASDSRSYKELLRLQGLPLDLDYPDFTVKGKKKLIGNGVPISMGRVIAQSVLDVTDPGNKFSVTDQMDIKRCKCPCKRIVPHKGSYYDFSCRKRYQRLKERDATVLKIN